VNLTISALNCGMDYYVRTTPPELIAQAIRMFDTMLADTLMRCITPADRDPPPTCNDRMERAIALARLPITAGGMGLTALSIKAPAAFLAATQAVLREEPKLEIESNRILAANAARESYVFLMANLDTNDLKPFPAIRKVLPASAEAMMKAPNTDNAHPISKYSVMRKVQAAIIDACLQKQRIDFRDRYGANCPVTPGTSQHDKNHVALLTARSQLSRGYKASLWFTRNRILPANFINMTRYHLNLPQMLREHVTTGAERAMGGEAGGEALCEVEHPEPKTLDPTGAHATACKTGAKGRYRIHTLLANVVKDFGVEAGGTATMEPATRHLLMERFDKDLCRVLFPKTQTADGEKRKGQMEILVKQFSAKAQGPARDQIRRLMQELVDETPGNWKGLRIDIQILFPDEEIWVDVGSVHPTPESSQRTVTIWQEKLDREERKVRNTRKLNSMRKEGSPCVASACRTKHKRYQGMVDLALQQKANAHRMFAPLFVAGIVSHSGEFASELITMVERFTRQFLKLSKTMHLEDGVSDALRTSDYRCRFKDAMMTAVMKGWGDTLGSAGLPWDRNDGTPALDTYSGFIPSMERTL
jgi:hypothetical protein